MRKSTRALAAASVHEPQPFPANTVQIDHRLAEETISEREEENQEKSAMHAAISRE